MKAISDPILLCAILFCALLTQCAQPPSIESFDSVENFASGRYVAQRRILVAAGPNRLLPFRNGQTVTQTSFQSKDNKVRYGSATPISLDGYMLTNHHVVYGDTTKTETVFVILPSGNSVKSFQANLIWSDKKTDLALLKIAQNTPNYFQFTQTKQKKGTPVIQAGIRSTRLEPGYLLGAVSNKAGGNGSFFEHSTYVQRGDSGGPVINLQGKLIGVNRSINVVRPLGSEIHLKSAAVRPNLSRLFSRIENHRRQNP